MAGTCIGGRSKSTSSTHHCRRRTSNNKVSASASGISQSRRTATWRMETSTKGARAGVCGEQLNKVWTRAVGPTVDVTQHMKRVLITVEMNVCYRQSVLPRLQFSPSFLADTLTEL